MKKLICIVLAGAMIFGLCACGKNGSSDSRSKKDGKAAREDEDDEDDEDDGDAGEAGGNEGGENGSADSTPEFGTDEYWASIQYYVDTTNDAELKKLIDAVISCEPKLGDDVNTTCDKVVLALGKEPIEVGLFSNFHTYDFEYGWQGSADYLDGKDRMISFGYWNYETDDGGELISDEPVVGYKESYLNPTRPGDGDVLLWVYDADRAQYAYDFFCQYLTEIYSEYEPEIEEDSLGYWIKCGEGYGECYAYVRKLEPNEEVDVWQVYACVYFADPELMALSEEAQA
ncbi:MAG: hypothetical protein K6F83_08060 [Clostridiales bacterium]|nr:hypothetical protein [Clostridiales bacterium]